MCNGDELILNPLFNSEPMKGFEHWEDVRMFGSASNGTCKSILTMFIYLFIFAHQLQYYI